MHTQIHGGARPVLRQGFVALAILVSLIFNSPPNGRTAQSYRQDELGSLAEPQDIAPPLPVNCDGLATPGGAPPATCVYGYVYLDGEPVSGASVTLRSDTAYLVVTTQPGPASPAPYFAATLSELPLGARAGAIVSAGAVTGSRSNRATFETASGSQQVDLWLSTTCGPTPVGGVIASDTTWTRACGPYIVTNNLLVQSGFKLTIEAGSTVLVEAGKALQVDGVLDAQGQANAMIALTSAAQTPTAGDWSYLLLADSGTEHVPFDNLLYVLIEYAGGAAVSENGALRMNNAWPSLQHLTVRHNASDGVHFYSNSTGGIRLSNIYNNSGWGISVSSEGLSAANDTLFVHHNGLGGIYLYAKGAYWLYDSAIAYNNGQGIYAKGLSTNLDFYAEWILVQGNRSKSNDGAGIMIAGTKSAYVSDSLILDNEAYGSTSTDGGGISCGAGCELYHNIVLGNQAAGNGGGIHLAGASISPVYKVQYNVIVENQAAKAGGGIFHGSYANASSAISNNTILRNQSILDGAGMNILSTLPVLANTILYNTSADLTGSGAYVSKFPVLTSNNLYANAPYDLSNGNAQGTAHVNAELNYWGTSDPAAIRAHIWDWLDDSTLGLVDFEPFAVDYNLDAPISPPTGLTASVTGNDVSLSWSASPEADLAGYILYYDRDGPGFPYNGSGIIEGDSPIILGPVTSYTLTGLQPGTYYVTLTAYDSNVDGVRDQTYGNESWYAMEQVVSILTPPNAGFSASPTSGPAPLTVNFTNTSTGDFERCNWDFGDGGSSTQCANPSHTYAAAGTYTVSLAVSGPAGADTEVKNAYITALIPAAADFSGTPTSGLAPLQVTFTNLSSGAYTTCTWTFGDGGSSSLCANPSHTYTAAGTYTVSLTVSGAGGTNTRTRPSYISISIAPAADFYGTPTRGNAPLSVQFTNLSSGVYDTCAWTFGEGGTSNVCANPIHIYLSPGVYSVSLTLSGTAGTDTRQRPYSITVTAPGDAWYSGGPSGGYINALALAVSNPEVIFAATALGVYKSTSGGTVWQKTSHPELDVKAIAIAPNNANLIFSGTTDGIYKSSDGGATWLPKGLPENLVGALAIDPRSPAILFAGTPGGIYKSVNSGETWVKKSTAPGLEVVHALLVDSDNSLYVYAVGSTGSGEDGFVKSSDGGETWTPRHVASDNWNDEDVFALAMTPAGAAPQAMYAFSLSGEVDVYKSADRGESWAPCNIPEEWWMVGAPVALAVDPTHPSRVYLGVGEYSGQVYKSPDAGATWQPKMNGLPEGKPASLTVDPRDGHVLVGLQNGGVYQSTDTAEHWSVWSAGLVNTDIVGLAFDPTNSASGFATIQGRGHPLAKTANQGLSWTGMPDIPSGYIPEISAAFGGLAYDAQNPDTIYIGDGWEYAEDLYLYKSINGGESWNPLKFMNGDPTYWEMHGVAEIWVHPTNSNILLLAVEGWGGPSNGGGVYRSTNGGYAWSRPLSTWATSLAADPVHPNVIYAGTRQCGYVYRSPDAGVTWTGITPAMPPGECWVWSVSDLEVDADGSVYAATSAGLMKWDGLAWAQLTGFPGLVTALAIDRTTQPSTVFIGTSYHGVHSSQDAGGTWTPSNEGLGTLSIQKLTLAYGPNRTLYAGTVYGGVWARNLGINYHHRQYVPVIKK
jgi:PKD repeat protein